MQFYALLNIKQLEWERYGSRIFKAVDHRPIGPDSSNSGIQSVKTEHSVK